MGTSQRCRYATVLWSTVAGPDEAFQEVVNKKGKQEREQGKGERQPPAIDRRAKRAINCKNCNNNETS